MKQPVPRPFFNYILQEKFLTFLIAVFIQAKYES